MEIKNKRYVFIVVSFTLAAIILYGSYRIFVEKYERLSLEATEGLLSFMQNKFREPESVVEFCDYITNAQCNCNLCNHINTEKTILQLNNDIVAIRIVFGRKDEANDDHRANYTFFDYLRRRDIELIHLSNASKATTYSQMVLVGTINGQSERIIQSDCIRDLGYILEKYNYENNTCGYSNLKQVGFSFNRTLPNDSLRIVLTIPQNFKPEFLYDIEQIINKYFYSEKYDRFKFGFRLDSLEMKKLMKSF